MSSLTPLVSVCIPTYRGGAYLAAAIESVLKQSLTDLELIVVDDQSPDDTEAIVRGFDDPRLRYVRNERNLGPQGNWNRCLELATGKYFKLLPHDDLLHEDCLERQVAALQADRAERLALVFSSRNVLGPEGQKLTWRGYAGQRSDAVLHNKDLVRACIRGGTNLIGEPGAVLFRLALAQRTGPFDASNPYVIDLDYWFRLLAHGDAYYLAAPLASFRVSRQQWSVELGRSQAADFMAFVQRISAQLPVRPSRPDLLSARIMATVNNLARRVFYSVYLR
ncbi:MAG TPA: glycosyltransferase family 2 protein [Roseateles sp.]